MKKGICIIPHAPGKKSLNARNQTCSWKKYFPSRQTSLQLKKLPGGNRPLFTVGRSSFRSNVYVIKVGTYCIKSYTDIYIGLLSCQLVVFKGIYLAEPSARIPLFSAYPIKRSCTHCCQIWFVFGHDGWTPRIQL